MVAQVGLNSFVIDKDLLETYLKTKHILATSPHSPLRHFYCIYSQANPQPGANNSIAILKNCLKHLEENPLPKDILE